MGHGVGKLAGFHNSIGNQNPSSTTLFSQTKDIIIHPATNDLNKNDTLMIYSETMQNLSSYPHQ